MDLLAASLWGLDSYRPSPSYHAFHAAAFRAGAATSNLTDHIICSVYHSLFGIRGPKSSIAASLPSVSSPSNFAVCDHDYQLTSVCVRCVTLSLVLSPRLSSFLPWVRNFTVVRICSGSLFEEAECSEKTCIKKGAYGSPKAGGIWLRGPSSVVAITGLRWGTLLGV